MKAYRIFTEGKNHILHRRFEQDPMVGDIFEMADGGLLQVQFVTYDFVNDHEPDHLMRAKEVNLHKWAEVNRVPPR